MGAEGRKSQPMRDEACKSRTDMKEVAGDGCRARQGDVSFFGERFREQQQQQQLEFISAVKKDTQDGTDKCFVRRM